MFDLDYIPQDLINFVLTALFALLIGLEQREHHEKDKIKYLFGTDRTFALIGILGFVLYILDKENAVFFGIGGVVLAFLLAIAYAGKIYKEETFGMTTVIVALITYCLAPIIYTQPPWLSLLLVIVVLVLVEIKEDLIKFARKFDENEFITLAVFIAITGVILPLLPDESLVEGIDLTPYKFWLAVVAVSAISYISYLLRKFVFPGAGLFLSGILGGMYSSTATVFSLAGKTKSSGFSPVLTSSAIIAATAIMYIRILVLAYIFNASIGKRLLIPMVILSLVSLTVALFILYKHRNVDRQDEKYAPQFQKNPLEIRTALVFALLFVFFAVLTHYVLEYYGSLGMTVLSYFVGVTDIDPFLINLFQDQQAFSEQLVVYATLQATISNNVLKAVYSVILGDSAMGKYIWTGFGVIIAASFVVLLFV